MELGVQAILAGHAAGRGGRRPCAALVARRGGEGRDDGTLVVAAAYDETYRPRAGPGATGFRVRETMDRGRARAGDPRAPAGGDGATPGSTRRSTGASGTRRGSIRATSKSLEDFEQVPVVTKEDLREARRAPAVRRLPLRRRDEIFHIHGTSGTTGRPTAFGDRARRLGARSPTRTRASCGAWASARATRVRRRDLQPVHGLVGRAAGAERLGANAFPFGAGVPGMTPRAVSWMHRCSRPAFYGTPSYALHLAEVAAESGVDPRELRPPDHVLLRRAGRVDPASAPDRGASTAARYRLRLDGGDDAVDERRPSRSAQTGMLCWQDIVYTEVCDPETLPARAVRQRGTPVYTHLERTSQPMIRLLSGDLTLWEPARARAGAPIRACRTASSAASTTCSRSAARTSIRARSTRSSTSCPATAASTASSSRARTRWTRSPSQVEYSLTRGRRRRSAIVGASATSRATRCARCSASRQGRRSFPPNTFPRTDFKARRVIDEREVFRESSIA